MPTKLTERALIKDLLKIARADTLNDIAMNAMIDQTGEEVERICRRKFAKSARVEYFTSYDQDAADPVPQYIWLDGPVDPAEDLTIVWSAYDRHATNGSTLTPDDYKLDLRESLITVRGNTNLANTLLPNSLGWPIYQYSPTGFQVTYTGGYPLSSKPLNEPADPLDDYGVIQVPDALKFVVARKVAADWEQYQRTTPWDEKQREWLKPWKKKDIL